MLISSSQLRSKFYGFHHCMEVNIDDSSFENDDSNQDCDSENPGFLNGWIHFLDVTTNSIVSLNEKEMIIEVMVGDTINCVIKTEERILRFLKLQDVKSKQFKSNEFLNNI